jgi:hypothetical protein
MSFQPNLVVAPEGRVSVNFYDFAGTIDDSTFVRTYDADPTHGTTKQAGSYRAMDSRAQNVQGRAARVPDFPLRKG